MKGARTKTKTVKHNIQFDRTQNMILNVLLLINFHFKKNERNQLIQVRQNLNITFEIFFVILWMWLQSYSTNTKRFPPEKVLEALYLFSQPEFPEKGGFTKIR